MTTKDPKPAPNHKPASPADENSHDRAPYQDDSDRDPVKSVEETRHIPSQGHGAVK